MNRKQRRAASAQPSASAFERTLQQAVSAAQEGRLAEAERLYRAVVALKPGEAALVAKLGDVLQRQGRLSPATELFRQAVAMRPDYPEGHMRLGNALLLAGDAEGAIAAYRASLALKPDAAEIWSNLGHALIRVERHDDGVMALRKAIELKPDFFVGHLNLGNGLMRADRLDDAAAALTEAVRINSDSATAWSDLGNVLYLLNRRPQALAAYANAIARDPNLAEAWSNIANPLTDEDRLDEAMAACMRSIELDPDRPHAHSNLGNVLLAAGRLDEAVWPYRHALKVDAAFAEPYVNLGHVLFRLGRPDEAIAAYRDAIRLRPGYADAHLYLAITLLRRGMTGEGWREYEWRWRTKMFLKEPKPEAAPEWQGEDLDGKDILLYAEQGYGDTLQFARYAKMLADRGARVTLAVPKPLARVMATVPGVTAVVADRDRLPHADYQLPMLGLPLRIGHSLADIPANVPYLSADADRVTQWQARFAERQGLKVGVAWAGEPRRHDPPARRTDARRSMALTQMAPLFEVPGVSFISLQKGEPARQIGERDYPVDAGPIETVTDFADTAAIVEALDLVIAVDTAIVHLAGGLGKPVWVLSRFDGCWRWLEEGDSSPWYPTARIFRQQAEGAWDEVMVRVAEALRITRQ